MRKAILKIMSALYMAKEFHPDRYKMVVWNPLSHLLLFTTCTIFGLVEFCKAFWSLAYETLAHALQDHGPPPQGLQEGEEDLVTAKAQARAERLGKVVEPTREFTPQGGPDTTQPPRLDSPEYS